MSLDLTSSFINTRRLPVEDFLHEQDTQIQKYNYLNTPEDNISLGTLGSDTSVGSTSADKPWEPQSDNMAGVAGLAATAANAISQNIGAVIGAQASIVNTNKQTDTSKHNTKLTTDTSKEIAQIQADTSLELGKLQTDTSKDIAHLNADTQLAINKSNTEIANKKLELGSKQLDYNYHALGIQSDLVNRQLSINEQLGNKQLDLQRDMFNYNSSLIERNWAAAKQAGFYSPDLVNAGKGPTAAFSSTTTYLTPNQNMVSKSNFATSTSVYNPTNIM